MRGFLSSMLVVISALASAMPADARPHALGARADDSFVVADRGRGRGDDRGRPEQMLPLEAVLGNIARQIPGHHLDVDGPFERGGRWIYRIKWLTPDGRVLIIFADAQTGQILETRGGR
ncbi:MAG: PepSY domain-containing protein [Alphaproteobacteria bacterium]|nr:PepSY domain-containing protein [Alphaproteobacteria bacterium]